MHSDTSRASLADGASTPTTRRIIGWWCFYTNDPATYNVFPHDILFDYRRWARCNFCDRITRFHARVERASKNARKSKRVVLRLNIWACLRALFSDARGKNCDDSWRVVFTSGVIIISSRVRAQSEITKYTMNHNSRLLLGWCFVLINMLHPYLFRTVASVPLSSSSNDWGCREAFEDSSWTFDWKTLRSRRIHPSEARRETFFGTPYIKHNLFRI